MYQKYIKTNNGGPSSTSIGGASVTGAQMAQRLDPIGGGKS